MGLKSHNTESFSFSSTLFAWKSTEPIYKSKGIAATRPAPFLPLIGLTRRGCALLNQSPLFLNPNTDVNGHWPIRRSAGAGPRPPVDGREKNKTPP
ncbi:unnamed protein product [Pleuronectes platessa]|uniref:Uncharacterized protein n=1 Tax=Pleuronectes platessa TaxID=8262 RepID=A0A9N7U409_PLEPL|nr:unnamed protein product [Pleuronectes platessa]